MRACMGGYGPTAVQRGRPHAIRGRQDGGRMEETSGQPGSGAVNTWVRRLKEGRLVDVGVWRPLRAMMGSLTTSWPHSEPLHDVSMEEWCEDFLSCGSTFSLSQRRTAWGGLSAREHAQMVGYAPNEQNQEIRTYIIVLISARQDCSEPGRGFICRHHSNGGGSTTGTHPWRCVPPIDFGGERPLPRCVRDWRHRPRHMGG